MNRNDAIEQAANEIAMALTRKGYVNIKNGKDEPRIDALYKALAMPKVDEFLKVRQQLEAEWVALRGMQRSYEKAEAARVELLERLSYLLKDSKYVDEFMTPAVAKILRDIRAYLQGGAE